MDSVYKQSGPVSATGSDIDAGADSRLLAGVARLCRSWADRLAQDDPLRWSTIRLQTLADELVLHGNFTSEAMNTTQALFCVICRRLSASENPCSGQALCRCPLLAEAGPKNPATGSGTDGCGFVRGQLTAKQ